MPQKRLETQKIYEQGVDESIEYQIRQLDLVSIEQSQKKLLKNLDDITQIVLHLRMI
jgi:hypothetical protein